MKKLLACIALGCIATANSYAGTPLWMRDVQISPDGKEIVFCYKGDIYKVPAKGGTATQLTTQSSYECTPIWSHDGKEIAFASDRNGNFDVFVMPADGGPAKRLTHSFGNGIAFRFYLGREIHTFLRCYSRPCQQCLVSHIGHDRAI